MADMNEMKVKDVSLETLKAYVKEQEQKKEEDYCLDTYEDVRISSRDKDLIFGNDARIVSSSDGIWINKKYIKATIENDCDIRIVLKGSSRDLDENKILWGEKK